MGLRINIPLPGPFSYSVRATPDLRKTARAVSKLATASRPPRECSCERPVTQPVRTPIQRPPIPPGGPGIPSVATVLWRLVIVFSVLFMVAWLVGVWD